MNKKKMSKALRKQLQAWATVIGCAFIMVGGSLAWYTREDRVADSKLADVMVPYYLELNSPNATAATQLSIGNLPLGSTKQIVFCVTNQNPDSAVVNQNISSFNYTLELVHTENMALDYRLYQLEAAGEGDTGSIEVTDTVTDENGQESEVTTYWKKTNTGTSEIPAYAELYSQDISEKRHKELLLKYGEDDTTYNSIVNKGKYSEFDKYSDGTTLLELVSNEDYQYFLLEIDWTAEGQSNFEKYEKETDMIYMLAKALQPEPAKAVQSEGGQ